MNQQRLWFELDRVAARFRLLRFWLALAAAWLIAAAAGLGLWAVRAGLGAPPSVALTAAALVAAILAVGGIWLAATSARNYGWLARRIETAFPELRTCLLAAVEQRPDLPDGRFGYLQSSVIHQALHHADRNAWTEVVPMKRIVAAAAVNALTFVLFVGVLALIALSVGPAAKSAAMLASTAAGAVAPKTFAVTVEPGNAEVERGTSLLVLARVTGTMPAEATLVFQSESGEESRLPMSPSLDDPVFGARIPLVDEPLDYRVELGGQNTPTYHVTVFEYPRVEKADARLVFPTYTKLPEKLVQDVRTVSVVEGTDLTLMCYLNKAVQTAILHEDQQPPLAMVASTPPASPVEENADPKAKPSRRTQYFYTAQIKCEKSRKLKLELTDEAGRKNPKPIQFTINVLPNQPPSLKPVFPARDLEVSALEELDVKATVYDDFGVVRVGLSYSINGQPPVDLVVSENGAAKQKHELIQQLKLEAMKAEPDQLLSYHWWAEDMAADGTLRRTMGDMYFAEVRPFEEIFRQGQQPAGGQQQQQQQQRQQGQNQNARDAQQLAQLQKDIINATWKLIRRETGSKPTDALKADAEQVRTSQESAIEQATALGERLTDEQSQEHIEAVLKSMQTAVEHLKAAEEGPLAAPLPPAMVAEQAAYQSLLKLRAREHEVVRQQQRQQRGQQQQQQQRSARSQQQQSQLNQLELRQDENRYQTQRAAQAQQQQETPEERENRQVLNRLKELARRQHDLNERVKELQAALEEARTEQQKEDIRQQLKRLQDEQQQILQDTDELQNRMDAPENQERMTEERQQLEQTREQVRRANEALNQEQVTQAAASGTRAEQQFEDLRNEFRRRASGRFNEEMRQMREAAQELDQKQEEIAQRLAGEQPATEQQPREQQPGEQQPGEQTPNNQKAQPGTKSDANAKGQPNQKGQANQKSQPGAKSKAGQKAKSLQGSGERERIAEELTQQRQRLGNLQERMRETIQQAEETEPLLSERLYDLDRNLQQQTPERALESAERSLRQGMVNDAQQQQQPAGESIRQLRQGIERAAETVLGDDTEALRRARQELQELSRQLNDEINRNNPNGQPQEAQPQEGQPQEGQPGEQQSGQKGQKGEGQKGEGQKGQGQKSQGQKGQGQKGQGQPGQKGQGQKGQKGGQPGENQPQEGQPPEGQGQKGQKGQGQKGEGQQGQKGQGQKGQGQKGQKGQGGGQGGGQPGENQEPQEGQPQDQQPQDGQPQEGQPGQRGQKGGKTGKAGQRGGQRTLTDGNPNAGPTSGGGNIQEFDRRNASPLTGEDFRQWSDRLRDVEEMVDDPALRAEAARIRERARSIRAEAQRHSAEPNWELVQSQVAGPLVQLRDRVAEELLRRTSQQAIVPLDRDPVPPQFSEKTRRYYERLGSGTSGSGAADPATSADAPSTGKAAP